MFISSKVLIAHKSMTPFDANTKSGQMFGKNENVRFGVKTMTLSVLPRSNMHIHKSFQIVDFVLSAFYIETEIRLELSVT
jgi:hypothetical protein